MLDDPSGIADRRLVGDQQGNDALAAEILDLVTVPSQPRNPHLVELDSLPAQLAGDLPARAEAVSRQTAAVERGHLRSVPAVH